MYDHVIDQFYKNQNPEHAEKMSAYMKNLFPFLGLPKPIRSQLEKEFLKEAKKEKQIDWGFIIRYWNLPEREFQYLAMDILAVQYRNLKKEDIEHLEYLIVSKSWWDSIDFLAASMVGMLCSKYPELVESHILKWSLSDNLWLRRTAILFQLKYKERTDTQLLSQIILNNNGTKEFFLNKAIGWILREYSKTNREWVKAFIENYSLHSLSVREASKYLTLST